MSVEKEKYCKAIIAPEERYVKHVATMGLMDSISTMVLLTYRLYEATDIAPRWGLNTSLQFIFLLPTYSLYEAKYKYRCYRHAASMWQKFISASVENVTGVVQTTSNKKL